MAERRYPPDFEAAVLARLDRLDRLMTEQARRVKTVRKAGAKRGRTVAERAAAGVRFRPTELQMAAARKKLRTA